MKSAPLTVEIFRDADTPEVCTENVEQGIAMVSELTSEIEVLPARRKLRIAHTDAAHVDLAKINWPQLPADISLIATERQLIRSGHSNTNAEGETFERLGHTYFSAAGPVKTRIAIVSSQAGASEPYVAAHELGHLFGVKPSTPVSSEDPDHWADRTCLLYDYNYKVKAVRRIPAKGARALLERMGLILPDNEIVERQGAESFCDDCGPQFDIRAFYMQMVKSGKTVPAHLLGHLAR